MLKVFKGAARKDYVVSGIYWSPPIAGIYHFEVEVRDLVFQDLGVEGLRVFSLPISDLFTLKHLRQAVP